LKNSFEINKKWIFYLIDKFHQIVYHGENAKFQYLQFTIRTYLIKENFSLKLNYSNLLFFSCLITTWMYMVIIKVITNIKFVQWQRRPCWVLKHVAQKTFKLLNKNYITVSDDDDCDLHKTWHIECVQSHNNE
jgi:hypothetical protein